MGERDYRGFFEKLENFSLKNRGRSLLKEGHLMNKGVFMMSCQNKNSIAIETLRNLSDEELDQNLLLWVKKEKEVLKEVLLHIAEVDKRRLYLRLAYSSMFAYLTERMGYEGGSAQRRLDAARLSLEVPTLIENLDRGEITLSQVAFLQKSLRACPQKATHREKIQLVEEIKNKSVRETQVVIAQSLNVEVKERPKVSHQADNSVRFEVTLSHAQWEKLQTMREFLSGSLPHGSWDEVLEFVADKVIAQKKSQNCIKSQVRQRDQCCQYRDPKTNKMCGSKWNLETDHIQPRWAGGKNELQNYRLLCASHNKELYRQQARIRRV